MKRRPGVRSRLDTLFFVLAGLASVWLAYLTLSEGVSPGWQMLLVMAFWVLVSYLVLPRLHRILSGVYVPGYFIGRTRTTNGLLGDPVNIALRGSADQVHAALLAAGWTRADEVNLATSWRIVVSSLTGRSYPTAPVSPLLLFERQQNFTYQQEVEGSPSKRHHVRFWQCPPGWLLPGGFAVDWLAAATFDRSVGLSLFTLQVTHKIDAEIDIERDYVVSTVSHAVEESQVSVLQDFSTGYHSRNGGGDLIETDGDLPIIDLAGLDAPPHAHRPVAAGRRLPPGQILFAVAVSALRAFYYAATAGLVLAGSQYVEVPRDQFDLIATVVVLLLAGLVDLGLGLAVLTRRKWARTLLCASSVVSVVSAFVLWIQAGGVIQGGLLPVAESVLVLLALSSDAARQYTQRARQHRPPPRPVGPPPGPAMP